MNNKLSNHFTFSKVIPISLYGQVDSSSQIIGGEVPGIHSSWRETNRHIYRANELNVYKIHLDPAA